MFGKIVACRTTKNSLSGWWHKICGSVGPNQYIRFGDYLPNWNGTQKSFSLYWVLIGWFDSTGPGNVLGMRCRLAKGIVRNSRNRECGEHANRTRKVCHCWSTPVKRCRGGTPLVREYKQREVCREQYIGRRRVTGTPSSKPSLDLPKWRNW